MIITIDGPVASGKSTLAKELARRLGMYYLYTGLLYRAVAYVLLQPYDYNDEELLRHVRFLDASGDQLLFIKDFSYDYSKDNKPCLFYKGEDISEKLYDARYDQAASIVGANKHIREALLDIQRAVATKYDIIADGRDCGSVIFPDANYKFYLTADVDTRAERLMLDERRKVGGKTLEEVKVEVEERDERDFSREVAPLSVPNDAITIDNTALTFDETVEKFLSYITV